MTFGTTNYKNNNINLLSNNGCDNIDQEKIIKIIKNL